MSSQPPKRPRSSDVQFPNPKRSRIVPYTRPKQSTNQGFLSRTFGVMSNLLGWGTPRGQESNSSDDDQSSSHSRASSPDPLDSIPRISSHDPPSPSPPAETRRPPVRPNRDAYSSQSSPFTWSATIDRQRRPLWMDRDDETEDRSSQRVISMFSGNVGALNRRRTLRKVDDRITGIRTVLRNDQATKSFDEVVQSKPQQEVYKPKQKREIGVKAQEQASKSSSFEFVSILKNLKALQLAKEKALKPSVPSKLSPQQESKVDAHLRNPKFKVTLNVSEVEAGSLRRLKPSTWLDDEVMNAYCDLMCSRFKDGKAGRKVHFLNSFFYGKLVDQGYAAGRLKRWTKKIDIFSLDVLIFPINQGNMHWTACAINFAKKRIEYYDSMGDYGNARKQVFRKVRGYVEAEHKEKKGRAMDWEGWHDYFNKNTPQQNNGSDCGVFSCQTLEMITRGRDIVTQGFEFTAKDMPFMRRMMIYEIGEGKLEKRTWGSPAL
ncbi:sentrin/sumo-specific protease [Cryptococcus neoformans AD2-60a]|nr:sentrin/sumo-specific protease [Cryptococcus neoformans var. grubii AD2-60a]OXC85378.1 sentrin/sumo-specific protease [Cryptococcus neoformans var. grubii AD1-7a]OXG51396.1 sentrin/sumo-specific protease [Cryptococcus neoformans var. grubii Th84]OXG89133.1 sentrin/sumo-specific protease [Cryptococcus neoformans var. grubii D17-1]OXG97031.1 sentrin/sumo-specific protease [Cryptococcus neoformans var. grubii A2-102-5]OXH13268.1 sentrin/sumo-specific protease [Cryptococcus neoformans var. grub